VIAEQSLHLAGEPKKIEAAVRAPSTGNTNGAESDGIHEANSLKRIELRIGVAA
jgi:hypothetical protein